MVIRVFRNKRTPQLGEPCSHTQRISEAPSPLSLHTWGPVLGEMSRHIKNALDMRHPLALIGAGSAINFIIDALLQHHLALAAVDAAPAVFLFTTRDSTLYKWTCRVVTNIVHQSSMLSPNNCLRIVLALTGSRDQTTSMEVRNVVFSGPSMTCSSPRNGRIQFNTELV